MKLVEIFEHRGFGILIDGHQPAEEFIVGESDDGKGRTCKSGHPIPGSKRRHRCHDGQEIDIYDYGPLEVGPWHVREVRLDVTWQEMWEMAEPKTLTVITDEGTFTLPITYCGSDVRVRTSAGKERHADECCVYLRAGTPPADGDITPFDGEWEDKEDDE